MPRVRRAAAPPIPTNALVASAVRYQGKSVQPIFRSAKGWQQEAWRQFDICSELRFASEWIANALSRIRLFPAETDSDGNTIESLDPKVIATVNDIFSGADGQPGLMHAFGLHLTVAGECYLVGRTIIDDETGESANLWEVIGINEMRVSGSTWTIDYGDGISPVILKEDDVVIRIWRPHPGRRIEADSPVRALLPVLTEIEYLTRHMFAQITSRLAGAGVLFLPSSVQFPPAQNQEGIDPNNVAAGFMQTLGETMMKPLSDPGNAASQVPIVVTLPDEAVDKPNLMHFWSPLDEHVALARIEAIKRFAIGMDLPPEVTLGMTAGASSSGGRGTGASHWGSWQIEEAAIKLHIEPVVDLIVNSITVTYIRIASGNDRGGIGYDASTLKLQPDRSKEAALLYADGEVKAATLRSASGFDESDAPDPDERKMWLLRKVASGSATPEQVGAALKQLGIDLPIPPPSAVTNEARPSPHIPENVTPGPPDRPDGMALLAASEVMVFRALERAGNRMRNNGTKPPGCPASETYMYVKANGNANALLEDAWSWAPQVLTGITDKPEKVTEALDSYCHTLLAEQAPHSRERLQRFLGLAEVT